MKKHTLSLALGMLLNAGATPADTVIGETPDTQPGKGFGGLSGFMAGTAAGGPIGAAVGAGVGWLIGGETQEATGLSGTAYRVARDGGGEIIVRSPRRDWSAGDRVRIVGNRLIEADDANNTTRSARVQTH
jgi:outer membrane lipoprotein SlyB